MLNFRIVGHRRSTDYGGGSYDVFEKVGASSVYTKINSIISDPAFTSESSFTEMVTAAPLVETARWFSGNNTICVLDLDSTNEMLAALTYVRRALGTKHYLIKSSGGQFFDFQKGGSGGEHYWMVLDMIDSFSATMAVVKRIPGVDPEWIRLTEKRGEFCLRAMPKRNHMNAGLPSFPEENEIETPEIRGWIKDFTDHYNSKEMKDAFLAAYLRLNINNMVDIAADPAFTF